MRLCPVIPFPHPCHGLIFLPCNVHHAHGFRLPHDDWWGTLATSTFQSLSRKKRRNRVRSFKYFPFLLIFYWRELEYRSKVSCMRMRKVVYSCVDLCSERREWIWGNILQTTRVHPVVPKYLSTFLPTNLTHSLAEGQNPRSYPMATFNSKPLICG